MARISISGIGIEYDVVGEPGAPALVLTPGGRFSKDSDGVPELAEALAAGGYRVLLWDRPNCGASDISFEGDHESELHARVLNDLIRELELGPVFMTGGSAGSRVSLIAATQAPELVSRLMIWWISGGAISMAAIAAYYTQAHAFAAIHGGMEAVAELPNWTEQIERNPRNRDILLAQDPEQFVETLQRWAASLAYSEITPVPGVTLADFAKLTMPTLILRNGKSDLSHTRRTSDWVHEVIPHSTVMDPPWPDGEYTERSRAGQLHGRSLFERWPLLAPTILEFGAAV
jgi:2-hydroxy-6-oxonona-2,4-dienedioate hydrolase